MDCAVMAASGFSQSTCFPACAARIVTAACSPGGVATYIAETCGSARQVPYSFNAYHDRAPNLAAHFAAFFLSRLTRATSLAFLLFANAGRMELQAMLPRPTTAKPTLDRVTIEKAPPGHVEIFSARKRPSTSGRQRTGNLQTTRKPRLLRTD